MPIFYHTCLYSASFLCGIALDELLRSKDELLAKEALHNSQSKNLEQKIKKILSENKVILQTDIYKYFDPVVQSDISSILYFMAKDGSIKRTKNGRTYLIEYLN